jgi:hypothetical protein
VSIKLLYYDGNKKKMNYVNEKEIVLKKLYFPNFFSDVTNMLSFRYWDYTAGGFIPPLSVLQKKKRRLLFKSLSQTYHDYIKLNPVRHISFPFFKFIAKREGFCRASGVVDACPICESIIKNEREESKFAEKSHKQLVGQIGVGLQIIAEHLPKGVRIIV